MRGSSSVTVVALDIEGRGRSAIRNGIVSIGMAVLVANTDQVMKTRFNLLPYENQVMDPQCWDEFWAKQGDLHETLKVGAMTPAVGMRQFRSALDTLSRSHPLYIVCDTPAYDFYFINAYLDREGITLLNFDHNHTFRATHDSDSYARGYTHSSLDNMWADNKQLAHDFQLAPLPDGLRAHAPEDDAHAILHGHVALVSK